MNAGPGGLPPGALAAVRLLALDVDGVLTDGTLCYGADGEQMKIFHVRDGLGIRMLQDSGVEVAVITARSSEALACRVRDLGIAHARFAVKDKGAALEQLLAERGLTAAQVAFAGDDLLDLPAMQRAGVAITVQDGHPLVKQRAHWVTATPGGRGAVREIADALLAARGALDEACRRLPGAPDPGPAASAGAAAGALAFRVVIPARHASQRLPGKPLRQIAGRTMIEHVWRNAIQSGAQEVLVATDDARIAAAVEGFGGRALMTSPDHASGTDRLAEVAQRLGWAGDTIVINLQGDEPCVPGALLRQVAAALHARPAAGIATVATPITEARELFDANAVKVVLDDHGMASYFSRAPIPWVRGVFDAMLRAGAGEVASLPADVPFLRHLGIYGYRAATLGRLAAEPGRASERAEALEQLRALALGIRIHVSVIAQAPGPGVDTEEDLVHVARVLASRGAGES